MIAAIYTRKSTEQNDVAEDAKSVTRQVEHAHAYAERKGWTVAEEHIYVDDGISGAEFVARPGFVRLMNALKPKPSFHVLIMSEESRLGREAIETAYALKQIVCANVRVFFYPILAGMLGPKALVSPTGHFPRGPRTSRVFPERHSGGCVGRGYGSNGHRIKPEAQSSQYQAWPYPDETCHQGARYTGNRPQNQLWEGARPLAG